MKTATPAPSDPTSLPAVLGICLALAGLGLPAAGQEGMLPALGDPAPEPITSYLEEQIPLPPWMSPGAPLSPDWARPGDVLSSFLRPGLGTTAFGSSSLAAPAGRPSSSPLRLGPLDLWPRLGYEVSYGNGLQSGPGMEENTWLNTITPSVTIAAGDHWTLGYTPSVRIYSASGYDDTVNHTVTVGGRTTWQSWGFGVNHATAITSDPLIETAAQTDQTTHSTGLSATLDRAARGAFDFSLNQNLRLTDAFPDVYSWSSVIGYSYPWRPKVRVGVTLGFGYDLMDPGTDMFNERLNLNLSGRITDKLSYTLGGGAEYRFFYGSDASPALSPLVNATLIYQVLDRTSLSLGLTHDVGTSYFTDQYTQNTSIQGGVTHNLTERWSVSGSGGYRFTSYRGTADGNTTSREDGTLFAQGAVNARITGRVFVSVFYTFSGNDSDQNPFAYDSNQFGLRLNWAL